MPRKPSSGDPLPDALASAADLQGHRMKVLSKADTATIRALAMCFLPRGGGIDHDAIDAGVLPFIDNWFAKLRPFELLRMRALFRLFEHYIAIENLKPFARFSTADRDDQIAYLSTWEHSGVYARRLAFQGVRSIITLAYDQHPGVQQQMGLGESEEQLRAQAERLAEAAAMLSGGGGKPTGEAAASATPRPAATPTKSTAPVRAPDTPPNAETAADISKASANGDPAAKTPAKKAARPKAKKATAKKTPAKKTASRQAATRSAKAEDRSESDTPTPSSSQAS